MRQRLGYGTDNVVVIYGANCRSRYGQLPNKPWGTCCLSPAGYRRGLIALIDLMETIPELRIVVKPHPADDIPMIRDVIDQLDSPGVSMVTNDMGFHNSELLAVSKLLVSSVSSMFAEAVVSDRVAVNLWLPEANYLYERARTELYGKISVTVNDLEELKRTVTRLLEDESLYQSELRRAKRNLGSIFGEIDGNNARRAVDTGCSIDRSAESAPRDRRTVA